MSVIRKLHGLTFAVHAPNWWDLIATPVSVVYFLDGWFVCCDDRPMHRKPFQHRDEAVAYIVRGLDALEEAKQ